MDRHGRIAIPAEPNRRVAHTCSMGWQHCGETVSIDTDNTSQNT